jgi:hypothetical protein
MLLLIQATMQRESNARFLLAVRLDTPTKSTFTFTFQRDLHGLDLYPVMVPRRQLQRLGTGRFFEYVADTYLAQQPAEALRVTRPTILFTLAHGL